MHPYLLNFYLNDIRLIEIESHLKNSKVMAINRVMVPSHKSLIRLCAIMVLRTFIKDISYFWKERKNFLLPLIHWLSIYEYKLQFKHTSLLCLPMTRVTVLNKIFSFIIMCCMQHSSQFGQQFPIGNAYLPNKSRLIGSLYRSIDTAKDVIAILNASLP